VVVLEEYVVVVVAVLVSMAGPPGSDMPVDPAGTVNVRVIIFRVESSDADGN
jgi:hypothetical protein